METKKKYPKSFYDDGLGDILEWIDDEVLVHSESKMRRDDQDIENKRKKKKSKKLYGDNEISTEKYKAPKRVKLELNDIESFHDSKKDKRLEDRARGLINRLAAPTMPFVASEFEKLYASNPRTSVDEAIFDIIDSMIICKNAITKRKLIAEIMLLVSYLNSKISLDIGASLVHRLVYKFESLYKKEDYEDEDKRMDNILCCLMNLYIIGLISSNVIFEIAKRICLSDFKPKSIELLLIIIKSVGFQLRKDNPPLMRRLIIMAQESSQLFKDNSELEARVEFMMDALSAIKNNNVSKLGNYGCDIDKDTIESTLKSLIHRTKLQECLSEASYEEILHSPNWYLLETRLNEKDIDNNAKTDSRDDTQVKGSITKKEGKICKALGLNKPTERTIFGALLRSSDFIEASNIIIGFGMNHCSDALLVCIHVAIHETKYNQFYFNLINNLCKFNRRYKIAAKFSIQDKIRTLGQMKSQRVDIFKRLCLELVKSDAIPITILKAIEWADISTSTKEYLEYLLENISELPDEERRKIMIKVDKKSSFAGAMRTFINCFMKGCRLFH